MQLKRKIALFTISIAALAFNFCVTSASAIDSKALNSDLSSFEERYFDQTFSSETTEQRLDRIERLVYGAKRNGTVDERVSRLLIDVPELTKAEPEKAAVKPAEAPVPTHMTEEQPVIAPLNAQSQPAATYPPQTGQAYPPQNGQSYPPPQTAATYPNQSAPTYPAQAAPSYPPQAGQGYPPQTSSAYGVTPPGANPYTAQPGVAPTSYGQQGRVYQAETAGAVPGTEDYPTVSALEKEIMGKTYENLPVQDRLANMEQKAFGAPSAVHDLSKRVEVLEEYAAKQSPKGEDYLASSTPAIVSPAQRTSLTHQVDELEKKIFHKTYGHDSLSNRLTRLEKSVFPLQPPQSFNPTIERIDRLEATVEPIQSPQTKIASQSHQHPLLHRLGKILGGVGMVAGEALGSAIAGGAMMGGYGMGGYGMGGYGMGYPGMGYGYGFPGMY